MQRNDQRGISLIEMMVVIALMGVMVGAVGVFTGGFLNSQKLKGAAENIAGEVRLAREKAITSGQDQVMHFVKDSLGTDFHIHRNGIETGWALPKGISYTFTGVRGMTLRKDGRASNSVYIILRDTRGMRDTVSVQLSGMVTT